MDHEVPIRIPLDLSNPDGECTPGAAVILGQLGMEGIATLSDFVEIPNEPKWCHDCGLVVFKMSDDGVLTATGVPSRDDFRRLRVPAWIQYDATPSCCGIPMQFVGQLDEPGLWKSPPPNARNWWHDDASFYVFTCCQCLSVKAIGQQD